MIMTLQESQLSEVVEFTIGNEYYVTTIIDFSKNTFKPEVIIVGELSCFPPELLEQVMEFGLINSKLLKISYRALQREYIESCHEDTLGEDYYRVFLKIMEKSNV